MSSKSATRNPHPPDLQTLVRHRIRKVALPRYQDSGEILRWLMLENLPGSFPYTAGVFPFKREGEDPTRMFAGEGDPYRTNRRFKLVSQGMPAKRLSTAFDSSRCMALIRRFVRISTAKSVTPVCLWQRWTI
jgi:methylmalonyl-CoA mutase N-terminal domain/subunit